ncbi:MAG: quinone-dependent dihydroorotate dehydrogenase [Elusimicrobia bacterium]|nr:quinone-dependent dihydroorotate dehydrogenase [Elusimicrobiota bacterium]
MSLYTALIRPLLFRLDEESAHEAAAAALALAGSLPGAQGLLRAAFAHADPSLETTVWGLRFPNPVGLAAGFDKDARLVGALPALGFGFVEVGTVTLEPQPGNPRPRLMRLPEARALLNRMGFNNAGAEAMAARLKGLGARAVPIGVNIGLNKDADPEDAPALYAKAFARLSLFGDYFVVNVSSPNTQGLRLLQDRLKLERILTAVSGYNGDKKPVLVKLAPDLEPEALEKLCVFAAEHASGVILTNTTVDPHLREAALEAGGRRREPRFQGGGLSGAPLRETALERVRAARAAVAGRVPIVGVGGISDAEDAWEMLSAGASLVQVYTALVYEGPGLPGAICRGLARRTVGAGLPRSGTQGPRAAAGGAR